jgi:hypothetical protein
MQLVKGTFYNAETGMPIVHCQFNPSELSLARTNDWKANETPDMKAFDLLQFGGTEPQELSMDLIFDTYEQRTDVRAHTNRLLSLMDVSEWTFSLSKVIQPRPPHVLFGWGRFHSFPAALTSASQTFTLFLPDGTPVRAKVKVALKEVRKSLTGNAVLALKGLLGQNPTSRATGAHRVRVVRAGDTIDSLAAQELGDPTAWRVLADANGLDDPRRLRPGQPLFVPSSL